MQHQLQAELDWRENSGSFVRLTLTELRSRLKALGYRIDPSTACICNARYLSGERAGHTYPCKTIGVFQIDDGLSFAHFEARRDSNFQALQAMRKSHYAVAGGRIIEF